MNYKIKKSEFSGDVELTISLEKALQITRTALRKFLTDNEMHKTGKMLFKGHMTGSELNSFLDALEVFLDNLDRSINVTTCKVWYNNQGVFELQGQIPLAA